MRLYYDDEQITIYNGDCRELLPLLLPPQLLIADPPYGISLDTDNSSRSVKATSKAYAPVAHDDTPFDPSHLLELDCPSILWGANYYADKLPPSSSWLVWDKLDGLTSRREIGFNNNADCELAWTNIGGPARIISHRWMGAMRGSQQQQRRVHPTEKPVALFHYCMRYARLPIGARVIDPYMGRGPIARACKDAGMRYIGIELVEAYCEHAVRLLRQEPLAMGA